MGILLIDSPLGLGCFLVQIRAFSLSLSLFFFFVCLFCFVCVCNKVLLKYKEDREGASEGGKRVPPELSLFIKLTITEFLNLFFLL